MSETDSQSIHGRKVFFLYPTVSVQKQIVTELAQNEFEVYVSKNHTHLSHVLKKYPDSVVYINVDEGLKEQEWLKWINTVTTVSKDILIGIFCSNNDDEYKEKYTSNSHVKCGYFINKVDMSNTINSVIEVLNLLNVKGRRKYVRVSPEKDSPATVNMPYGGDYIVGSVRDVSSVGISVVFEQDPEFTKNTLCKDIQLKLQPMLLKVEAVVLGSRADNNEVLYVFLFTQRIDPDVRVKIRKYIQTSLQQKMDNGNI